MSFDPSTRNPLGQPAHSQQRAGSEGIRHPSAPGAIGNHEARIVELEKRLRRKIEPTQQQPAETLLVTTLERNGSASLPFTITAGGSLTIDASYFDQNADGGDVSTWWDETDGLTKAGIFDIGLKLSWLGSATSEWRVQHNANWWHFRQKIYGKNEAIEIGWTKALSPGNNQLEFDVKNLGGSDWSVTTLRVRIAPVLFIDFIDGTF